MRRRGQQIVEVPVMPEDYFESTSLKNAVWQYLIDHAQPRDGQFKIFFFIPSEEEFWRRVQARKEGRFKRNDLLKMKHKLAQEEWHFKELRASYKKIMKSKIRAFIYKLLIK